MLRSGKKAKMHRAQHWFTYMQMRVEGFTLILAAGRDRTQGYDTVGTAEPDAYYSQGNLLDLVKAD